MISLSQQTNRVKFPFDPTLCSVFYACEFFDTLKAGPVQTGSQLNRKKKKEIHFISMEFEMCIHFFNSINYQSQLQVRDLIAIVLQSQLCQKTHSNVKGRACILHCALFLCPIFVPHDGCITIYSRQQVIFISPDKSHMTFHRHNVLFTQYDYDTQPWD